MIRFLLFIALWITALPALACVLGPNGGDCGNMLSPLPWWAIPLVWIFGVMFMTISEGGMELIGHIGILSLIAYYYFAFNGGPKEQVEK